MNKSTRKAIIAGNWKMNMTPSQAGKLISELIPAVKDKNGCEIIVCVPFVDIPTVVDACKGTNIKVGAQNVHFMEKGAYTGEISAAMLKECGVEYTVIGHSERRQYFGETDETVNLRLKAALAAGIKPILCVGENLEQRKKGITSEIVSSQTKIALLDVSSEDIKNVIIAYEPVWAIGTGVNATEDQADEVCGIIRSVLAGKYGKDIAESITVQYGGSMKPSNASKLLSMYNVDGGLIGGASLTASDFTAIVDAAQ